YELLEHPDWLDLQPCTVNGKSSDCLIPVGVVPTSAGNNFSVHLRVTSKASGKPSEVTYNKNIAQVLPGWASNPSAEMAFADTATGIDLTQFIQTGRGHDNGNPNEKLLYVELKNPNDPNWSIDANNQLHMTAANPGYNNPDSIGQTIPANVIAY